MSKGGAGMLRQLCTVLMLSTLAETAVAADGFSGHIEVGARETDVQGDEAKYKQYVNLDDGARVFGLQARFSPEERTGNTPDLVNLEAYGIGGEPFERMAAEVRKYDKYRFSYQRQQSDYFYEDILIRPKDASVESSTGGDFHQFDFERTREQATLALDLSKRSSLTLDFHRYDKEGDSTTVVDVEREEFEMEQPVDERFREATVGFEYAWDRVTVVVSESWQHHENDMRWLLPGFSLGSEPAEPTELDFFLLRQPYDSDAREHALNVLARPTDKLELAVAVRDIDLELDINVDESSQGLDFTGAPFARAEGGAGAIDRDTALVDVSAGYTLTKRWRLDAKLRRYATAQDGDLFFDGVRTASSWEIDNLGVDLTATVEAIDDLRLTLGWHMEKREVDFIETASGASLASDEDTDANGYYLQANYQPNPRARLTLSAEERRIDDPYTLASSTDSQRYRLRGSYRFDNGVSLTAILSRTDFENDNSGWESTTDQVDVRVAYAGERLQASAGVALVDIEHEIDQVVQGDILAFRQDLFLIRYEANSSFWDATLSYALDDRWRLQGSFRAYDNDGSFDVERDDIRAGVSVTLPQDYILDFGYRNIDYAEDDIEHFDADVWEMSLRINW